MQILLVRTPLHVVKQGYVGIGWRRVDFSTYSSAGDVIRALGDIGKRQNTVKRFFNLAQGDIVVVPLKRSFAIGKVSGAKRFVEEEAKHKACNQVAVEFFCDKNGKIIQTPRGDLIGNFQKYLKIRRAAACLSSFKDEIEKIILKIEQNGGYQQSSYLLE